MVNAGAGPESTVTVNEQVVVFPEASVAMTFTIVSPRLNIVPDEGLATRPASAQLSEALGVKLTLTGHPPAAVTLISVGQTMLGGSVSLTMTLNEQVASGGTPLVAVTTTVFVPRGKANGELIGTPPSL